MTRGGAWVFVACFSLGWAVRRVEGHPEQVSAVNTVSDHAGAGEPLASDEHLIICATAPDIGDHALQPHPVERLTGAEGAGGRHDLEGPALAVGTYRIATKPTLKCSHVRQPESFARAGIGGNDIVDDGGHLAHLVRVPREGRPECQDEGEDVGVHGGLVP